MCRVSDERNCRNSLSTSFPPCTEDLSELAFMLLLLESFQPLL